MALADERYMLLTTFRRDGTPVATPVWVAPYDEHSVAFWTGSGSGKAKRLAHTQRVTVQPSDARGRVKPGTEPVEATARVVSGEELEAIRKRVFAKYGLQARVTKVLITSWRLLKGKHLPYADRGVIVTPASADEIEGS
jgi:uncharacterized protein